MASDTRKADGAFDFSLGVDSGRVPTVQSQLTPHGLPRNALAWAYNATCRGGAVSPRPGFTKLGRVAGPGCGLYQSGYLYDASALDPARKPYLMLSVGGRILQVRVDTDNSVVDLSAMSGLTNPAGITQGFMCQGEEFLVIQAGDYTTLPLFWDGAAMRRSTGILNTTALPGGTFTVPAIGAPVLVTVATSYGGVLNQRFTIGGYHYIQIDRNQVYTVAGFSSNAADALKTFTVIANSVWADAPDAKFLLDYTNTFGVGPLPAFAATTCYCESTALNIFPYGPILIPGVAGNVTAQFVATPLAAPAANQVYLLNIDDPRAGTAVVLPTGGSELPAAGPMDYYMGRLWYAQNRTYAAGDIVRGPSGTAVYAFRDSILEVTENPLAIGGDGFAVATNSGGITALTHPANLNAAMGQGQLTVFTPKTVYQLTVPVTRTEWIAANSSTDPLQTVVQGTNGTTAERSVVSLNGDLFYDAVEGIRSLITALRYFGQWANPPISNNLQRGLDFNDDTLMQFASAVVFDNRLLHTCWPIQTDVGVAFRGIFPLDFDLISTLQEQLPPAWEGSWEGLNVLQLFAGQYGSKQRCFAVVAAADGGIDVWEITKAAKKDGDNRIVWGFETPAWTVGQEQELKRLDGGEIWIDRLSGTVEMQIYYRPDGDPCWHWWHQLKVCSAADTCENALSPICYPESGFAEQGECYKYTLMLPFPPMVKCATQASRPLNHAFQFQVKVIVKGFCRVRGLLVYMSDLHRAPYEGLNQ